MKKTNLLLGAAAVTAAAAYLFYRTPSESEDKTPDTSPKFKSSEAVLPNKETMQSSVAVTKEAIKSILNIPEPSPKDYSIIYLDKV